MYSEEFKVESKLKVSINKISLDEEITIYLDIINNESEVLQNVYSRIFVDKRYLELVFNEQSGIKISTGNSIVIGDIIYGQKKNFQFKLKLNRLPKSSQLTISAITYYSLKKDNYYIQGQSGTNKELIYIYYADLKGDDGCNFFLTANKPIYRKNEKIMYTLNVLNSGNLSATEIIITDFIPKNTKLIYESIKVVGTRDIYIDSENIIINEIKGDNSITIVFQVKLDLGRVYDHIESRLNLEYKYYLNTSPFPKVCNISSNYCKVKVNRGNIFSVDNNFKHIVDKEIIYLDEIVTNTIVLNNTTEYRVSNLRIQCFNLEYMNFVSKSLYINGDLIEVKDLYCGIVINEIDSHEEVGIEYKTKVVKVPKNTCLKIYSKVIYDLNNGENIEKDVIDTSEIKEFFIKYTKFNEGNFEKTVDKNIVSIGEEVNITLRIENKGNIKARNLFVCDEFLDCLEFVEGSLKINSQASDEDIKKGIYLGDLKSNYIYVLEYKAIARKIKRNVVKSYATIDYTYIDFYGNDVKKKEVSNTISLQIRGVELYEFRKGVNKNHCKLGDILSFNISVENRGNCEAYGLKLSEVFNDYLEIIDESTFINDVNCEDDNIYSGIWVDMLMPDEKLIIKYMAKVTKLPKSGVVSECCKLEYMYNDINSYGVINKVLESNSTDVIIKDAVIECSDINSKINDNEVYKYTLGGKEIYFNIVIQNNGNCKASNISFKEVIGNEFNLVSGSFYINNTKAEDNEFIDGIIITELYPKDKAIVRFKLIPLNKNIKRAQVVSKITYMDISEIRTKRILEYIENIEVINPEISIYRNIDKKIVYIGDEISEIITIANVGNVNLNNIKLSKNKYNFLEYIDSSLKVDCNFYENDNFIVINDLDIGNKINILSKYIVNNLCQNECILDSIKFYGKAKSIEKEFDYTIEDNSNEESIYIINNSILIEEKIDNLSVITGDNNKYSVIVKNNGNIDCNKIILDINFNKNIKVEKLIINGECNNNTSLKDIYIGKLMTGNCIEVVVFITAREFMDNNKSFLYSTVRAEFDAVNGEKGRESVFKSKGINVTIEECKVSLISKCNNEIVNYGEEIDLENIIYNEGTINIKNISLEQRAMNKFFLKSSYYESHDECINSNDNVVMIDNIAPGDKVIIKQKYIYTGEEGGGVIESKARAIYEYINPSNNKVISDSVEGNMIKIEKTIATFKEININGDIYLKSNEPNIYEVASCEVEFVIVDNYTILSIENVSYENQILTGKKVIVNGLVRERIEYISDNELKTVYILFREYPLSTFMIIPKDKKESNMNFNVELESIYFRAVSNRKIFRDINLVLEGY